MKNNVAKQNNQLSKRCVSVVLATFLCLLVAMALCACVKPQGNTFHFDSIAIYENGKKTNNTDAYMESFAKLAAQDEISFDKNSYVMKRNGVVNNKGLCCYEKNFVYTGTADLVEAKLSGFSGTKWTQNGDTIYYELVKNDVTYRITYKLTK